ncbi:MAG: type II toxin-antitoxin system HicB family antitoxin [Dehalococcoidales bacterium]|nr:type II toxin-antitoxin system HicB family antitoxin [Dehalococcoidales bacterium]
MRDRTYSLILFRDPDDGTYTVKVPALPGLTTQGASLEEAIAMAKDAITLYVEDLIANGEPVPEEAESPEVIRVRVAA